MNPKETLIVSILLVSLLLVFGCTQTQSPDSDCAGLPAEQRDSCCSQKHWDENLAKICADGGKEVNWEWVGGNLGCAGGCVEKELVGASCGTVTPGYNDQCCAERNKDTIHIQCVGEWKYTETGDPKTECSWVCDTSDNVQIANPASKFCVNNGYKLEMRTDSGGGQFGVCVFPDSSECDEWEFFRGECGEKWRLQEQTAANDTGATASGIKSVVDANNQFAFELYSRIGAPNQNLLFSPYGISSALAITYEGAREETADEIKQVFHFPKEDSARRPAFARLYNLINAPTGDYQLSTANALWIEDTYPLLQEYVRVASEYYAARATNLDFIRNAESSRVTINNWVEAHTNDKIKNLIPQGAVDPMTRLVITNAVYFKGKWALEFDPKNTHEEDFQVMPSDPIKSSPDYVKAQMMHLYGENAIFNYTENYDLQAIELNYEGGEVSMLILLPKGLSTGGIESYLEPGKLARLRDQMKTEKLGEVAIPRFNFETQYELDSELSAMGMPIAFSPGNADFSGMDGTKDLYISKVIHKAFIEVNEEGTEAAAATAVIMALTSMPEHKTFRADHPFVFVIQEKKTGAVLFLGRVADPTA